MVNIRTASPADEGRILCLWQQFRAHHDAVQEIQPAGWTQDPEVTLTNIREAWNDPDHCRIFVAALEDEIQGFVKVSHRTNYYEHCEINILAVDPAHRGASIGTELMAVATQWCVDNGEAEVELGVVPGNVRAVRLYERLGFQPYLVRYVKKLH
jgi:ribosomal protein S18 acetylase RimI-like enzyme